MLYLFLIVLRSKFECFINHCCSKRYSCYHKFLCGHTEYVNFNDSNGLKEQLLRDVKYFYLLSLIIVYSHQSVTNKDCDWLLL